MESINENKTVSNSLQTKCISMMLTQIGRDIDEFENDHGILTFEHTPLCNFVFNIDKIEQFKDTGEPTEQIILEVRSLIPNSTDLSESSLNIPEQFAIPAKAKDNIKIVSEKLGLRYLIYDKKTFEALFLSMIPNAKWEEIYHISKIGWQDNDTYAFANGVTDEAKTGKAINRQFKIDARLKGYALKIDPATVVNQDKEKEAARLVTEHLFRTTKTPIAKFLYIYLTLSILTTKFLDRHRNEAPEFTPMIVAKPLTGKTYLCNTLLYYMQNNPQINLSVGTTYSGFLNTANKAKDCIFLADDNKLDATFGKKSEDIINSISRMKGNNAPRSNAYGSQELECVILITGEVLPQLSFSSISRLLIWNLEKDDINRNEENFVRENAELYAAHILSLIRWLRDTGTDSLTDELLESFYVEKELLLDKDPRFNERVAASYAWLLAVYKVIVLRYIYFIDIDYTSEEDTLKKYALQELNKFKKDHLAEDPLYMFCKVLQHSKHRMVIDSQNSTVQDKHLGTYDKQFYYILEYKLDNLIDDTSMGADKKRIVELLSENNMLNDERPRFKYMHRHRINKQEEKVYQIYSVLVDNYVDDIDKQINSSN